MTAGAAIKQPVLMSVDEFLAWPGDDSGLRYELVDGVLRAQDPASDAHGTIESNLAYAIIAHLRATRPDCRVGTSPGVQPRLRADWNYREPELGVTSAPNRRDGHMIPEPVLLVEILSPSNAKDTWGNIALYATIPSVTEILIVSSTTVGAEVLRRQADGSWPQNPEAVGPDGPLRLASIGLDLAMADVYRGTYLAA